MIRKPLVIIDGRVQELPIADSLAGGLLEGDELVYSKRVDFVSDSELYKAEAAVGSLENSAVWRIRKIVLSADGDVTETWAAGSADFTKQWNLRTSYTYV